MFFEGKKRNSLVSAIQWNGKNLDEVWSALGSFREDRGLIGLDYNFIKELPKNLELYYNCTLRLKRRGSPHVDAVVKGDWIIRAIDLPDTEFMNNDEFCANFHLASMYGSWARNEPISGDYKRKPYKFRFMPYPPTGKLFEEEEPTQEQKERMADAFTQLRNITRDAKFNCLLPRALGNDLPFEQSAILHKGEHGILVEDPVRKTTLELTRNPVLDEIMSVSNPRLVAGLSVAERDALCTVFREIEKNNIAAFGSSLIHGFDEEALRQLMRNSHRGVSLILPKKKEFGTGEASAPEKIAQMIVDDSLILVPKTDQEIKK